MSAVRLLTGLALATSLTGCIFTSPTNAAYLSSTAGKEQNVALNAPAPTPLTATVLDQNGRGKEGVDIQWKILSGSGTLSSETSVTDSDGKTSVTYTAGTTVGKALVVAMLPELGSTVSFTMTIK